MEALGSLLSWDEAAKDDDRPATNLVTNSGKGTDPASSNPLDMVVFTTQDGIPQFNFVPPSDNTTAPAAAMSVAQAAQREEPRSMSVPMPLPTPIAGLKSETAQDSQVQTEPVAPSQPQLAAPASNQAPLPNAQPAIPNQQQAAFMNANLFLRQLQFAQLQQQIQAAQMQQQQPAVAAAQMQQQQQPATQQPQQPMPFATQPFPNLMGFPVVPPAIPTVQTSMPALAPAPKKARTTPLTKSPRTAKKSVIGTVSASDTEGETAQQVLAEEMTPVAKAQANRDRNREHARNTRLRKKAYLEKLKSTVDELCRERDTLVSERAAAANLLLEVQSTRQEVLLSFFALRSGNEKKRKLWASIFDECRCTCSMPVTPYRSFPTSEVQLRQCNRTIQGIDGIIADTASLHVLLDCLVDREAHRDGKIAVRYTLITEEAVVAQNQMMARWTMETTNAVAMGAKAELSKQGMLSCKFNGAHKITSLEFSFDVMAFMLQLKRAAGTDSFAVVPNTVQTCQHAFNDKPMVLTMAHPPYTIIQVNEQWEQLTGYSSAEVVGRTSCRILQDPNHTQRSVLHSLLTEVRHQRATFVTITNRRKDGSLFDHCLAVFPLSAESRNTYAVGFSIHLLPPPITESKTA